MANPELLFVHIPKCGGMSMRRILRNVYTDAILIDRKWPIDPNIGDTQSEYWRAYPSFSGRFYRFWKERTVPPPTVIMGHIPVDLWDGLYPDANIITVIRNPICRVISQIHYHSKKAHPDKDPYELIYWPNLQNELQRFMDGNTSNFDYILTVEHYQEDLERLAKYLDWERVPKLPHRNDNSRGYNLQSILRNRDVLEAIKDNNRLDLEIYSEVLSQRRLWK